MTRLPIAKQVPHPKAPNFTLLNRGHQTEPIQADRRKPVKGFVFGVYEKAGQGFLANDRLLCPG